ncbi:MAG: hypothetical protein JW983_07240 [Elusimicrobia bacterium]|nr:hypothetical protein [Elusimicrobiota bacterium]
MKKNTVHIIILCIIGIWFFLPILRNITYWGIHDWDEHILRHAVERDSIVKYGQLPLWNPYQGGGFPSLGNFKSICASPLFLFTILFGPIVGLKLIAIVCAIIGLIGTFRLAREWGITTTGAYLASFVFMLSSYLPLRIAEGNPEDLAQCWLPWTLIFASRVMEDNKNILKNCVLTSIFFCISCLQSGSNQIMFNIFLFLILFFLIYSVLLKKWKGILYLGLIFALVSVLCSFRFLPVLETSKYIWHKTKPDENQPKKAAVMFYAFLGRDQALDSLTRYRKINDRNVYNWEEFGCYVGWSAILLAITGLFKLNKRKILLCILIVFFSCLYLGCSCPVNLWYYLHLLPVFCKLYIPSRCAYIIAFIIAVLAGYGFSIIENNVKHLKIGKKLQFIIIVIALVFILFDFTVVTRPILKNIYVIPPQNFEKGNFIQDARARIGARTAKSTYSNLYPKYLSNRGEIDAKGHVSMTRNALPVSSPLYKGEWYLKDSKDTDYCKLRKFTNNAFWIDIKTKKPDTLVINQNYFCGWKVKGIPDSKVEFYNGRITVQVPPGEHKLKIYYLPRTVILGFLITSATVILCILFFIRQIKWFVHGIAVLSVISCIYAVSGIQVTPQIKYVREAMNYKFKKNLDTELEKLNIAVNYYPDSTYIRNRLSEILYIKRELDKSIKELQYMSLLRPYDSFVYSSFGNIYRQKRQNKKAFNSYKKSLSLNLYNDHAHFGLGLMYVNSGMYKEAENEFKIALKINPFFTLAKKGLEEIWKIPEKK